MSVQDEAPVVFGEQFRLAVAEEERRRRYTLFIGGCFLASTAALGVTLATDSVPKGKLTLELPYYEQAQQAVIGIQKGLEGVGAVMLLASPFIIGATKVAARKSNKADDADFLSSKELSDNGRHERLPKGQNQPETQDVVQPHIGARRRKKLSRQMGRRLKIMELVFAGSMPVLASMGAGLATFSTAVGNEVTEGPSGPITAFDNLVPGSQRIVESPNANPMEESYISRDLLAKVTAVADRKGVPVGSFDLALGDIQSDKPKLFSLAVGADVSRFPLLTWNGDCKHVPVAIDGIANIDNGSRIKINNLPVEVVQQTSNISAMNRIGAVMDMQAMSTCIKKSKDAAIHSIALDTTPEMAQAIYREANTQGEISALITKQGYAENSVFFWEANVKPITNVLSLNSFNVAIVAMSGAMLARMLRNKREWAHLMANGLDIDELRATELCRSFKDGIYASAAGVIGAAAVTPLVNTIESGMKVGVDARSCAVGIAVGVLGPVGGTMIHLIRPQRVIDKSRDTRV